MQTPNLTWKVIHVKINIILRHDTRFIRYCVHWIQLDQSLNETSDISREI